MFVGLQLGWWRKGTRSSIGRGGADKGNLLIDCNLHILMLSSCADSAVSHPLSPVCIQMNLRAELDRASLGQIVVEIHGF